MCAVMPVIMIIGKRLARMAGAMPMYCHIFGVWNMRMAARLAGGAAPGHCM